MVLPSSSHSSLFTRGALRIGDILEGRKREGWIKRRSNSILSKTRQRWKRKARKQDQIEIVAKDPTPTLKEQELGISPAESQLGKQSLHTIKETRDASVQEGLKLEKGKRANLLSNVPSEILRLVKPRDGELDLLADALVRYPQLRLSRERCSRFLIAFYYRVLINILAILATRTPCTITTSDKSTLESYLDTAIQSGFDKDWIESVRAKVFGNDVSAMKEQVSIMEAELEAHDVALEQLQKVRAKAKHKLARVQTQLEAIDSEFLLLLEDRKKFTIKMSESREIISANDKPFGI